MKFWERSLWGLLVLGACLAVLAAIKPQWAERVGLGDSERPDAEQRKRSEKLDYEHEVLVERIKAKREVTRRLVRGELTLLEAAAWFEHCNDNPPDCPQKEWLGPNQSRGEYLTRQVIHWVRVELDEKLPPTQVEERIRKLETELQNHITQFGTVRLPKV
jgi:hypothetical protein